MNFEDYKRAVPRTLPPDPMHPAGSLPVLALGLCEEWLEFIQSRDAHGRGCGKELGDVLWYIVATAERIGMLEHICIGRAPPWECLDLWEKAGENQDAACMVAGIVKKHVSNGSPLAVGAIFALLQKMLHNFNFFVQLTTMTFEQVLDANVQKGLDRYPNGWIDVLKEVPVEKKPFDGGVVEKDGQCTVVLVPPVHGYRLGPDTVDGTDRPPARYTHNGRETIDTMRDHAYAEAERQLGPGPLADQLADLLFAFHCEATALKYSDRSGSKGDPDGDAKKCAFYRQMAAYVRSPGQYPDPRCLRPGFQKYERQPVVNPAGWGRPLDFVDFLRPKKTAEELPEPGVEVLGHWIEENRFDVIWRDPDVKWKGQDPEQDEENVWVTSEVWNADPPDEWFLLPPRGQKG